MVLSTTPVLVDQSSGGSSSSSNSDGCNVVNMVLPTSIPAAQPSRKRKLSESSAVVPIMAKATATTAPTALSSNPVAFLHRLFASTKFGQETLARPRRSSFQKPSPTEIEAYDLAVVRGVREGNIATLRSMLHSGKTMNAANRFGESLIALACRRGDAPMVHFLIREARVRLDIQDDYGRTPLHDACWTSTPNFSVMDELLQACSPEMLLAEDIRGHTPFQYARKEHWDDWEAFLKARSTALLSKLEIANATIPASSTISTGATAATSASTTTDTLSEHTGSIYIAG